MKTLQHNTQKKWKNTLTNRSRHQYRQCYRSVLMTTFGSELSNVQGGEGIKGGYGRGVSKGQGREVYVHPGTRWGGPLPRGNEWTMNNKMNTYFTFIMWTILFQSNRKLILKNIQIKSQITQTKVMWSYRYNKDQEQTWKKFQLKTNFMLV